MATFPLDTLKMAQRLEASGMDRTMARGVVEVVVDALRGTHMATSAGTKIDTAASRVAGCTGIQQTPAPWTGDASARVRRDLTLQLGGMVVMWVCISIIGFSCLLPYR